MGSCLGHCRLAKNVYCLRYWKYRRESNEEEDGEDTVEDTFGSTPVFGNPVEVEVRSKFDRITSFFSKLKPQKDSSLRLELLDDAWCSSDHESTFPIPQVPAQRKPKSCRSLHSTPANSMELEWEHLPEMVQQQRRADVRIVGGIGGMVEEAGSGTSASAWSRGSSRDSLEWDPRADHIHTEDDDETEQLLQEIELLSCRALEETQEWTS